MRTQLTPIQGIDGRARPFIDRYVLQRGGLLDRAPDLTGLTGPTRQAAIDAFIAGEDLVSYYPLEASGAASTTYPLTTDNEGRCPGAWFPPGSYDHYVPDDLLNPLERWEAIAFGGIEVDFREITADVTQTGVGSKFATGLEITFEPIGRPMIVRLKVPYFQSSTSSGWARISLMEGATTLDYDLLIAPGEQGRPVRLEKRFAAGSGPHTVTVKIEQLITGNAILKAEATRVASIHVTEL